MLSCVMKNDEKKNSDTNGLKQNLSCAIKTKHASIYKYKYIYICIYIY